LKNAIDLDLVAAVKKAAEGGMVLDPQLAKPAALKGERGFRVNHARAGDFAAYCGGEIE